MASSVAMKSNSMIAQKLQLEFVENSDAFEALSTDWQNLCARTSAHHYFQTFDWPWRAWQRVAMVRGRRLCILVGRWHGQVVLLWPLMRDGHQVRLIASDKVEYRDLIVEDGPHTQSWMSAAWTAVKSLQGIDLLLFQDIKSDSNLARLMEANSQKGWKHERRSRVISLDRFENWNDYAKTLPKKLLSDQRRQWRRIGSRGDEVKFETINSKEGIQAGLDWMVHHKLAWLKASEIDEVTFGSPEYRAFITSVVQNAFDTKHLFFAKLSVGDNIVAAGLGYRYGTEFTFHMFTYDAAWQNFSPARLLLENIVRWCFNNGVTLFDFMPGEENYKGIWASDEFIVTDYMIPITLTGWFITKWHASGLSTLADNHFLTAIYHCLPSAVRQRVSGVLLAHREYGGRLRKA